MPVYLSACMSACMSACLPVCLPVCLSICLSHKTSVSRSSSRLLLLYSTYFFRSTSNFTCGLTIASSVTESSFRLHQGILSECPLNTLARAQQSVLCERLLHFKSDERHVSNVDSSSQTVLLETNFN